jgi:Na+/glutamate symporter
VSIQFLKEITQFLYHKISFLKKFRNPKVFNGLQILLALFIKIDFIKSGNNFHKSPKFLPPKQKIFLAHFHSFSTLAELKSSKKAILGCPPFT